jgi:hypothetical protein
MDKNYQIEENPLSAEFDFESGKIGYGIFQSKIAKIKLDASSADSLIVLSESELVSVQCDFQYFQMWLKKKQINPFQIAIINFLFSKENYLRLTTPLNLVKKLVLINIDIRMFKNYILNQGYFKVYDRELHCYQEHIDCKQVNDHPAIAVGTSKLIYSYRNEVLHEKILMLY